jgi:hypothetical protein
LSTMSRLDRCINSRRGVTGRDERRKVPPSDRRVIGGE